LKDTGGLNTFHDHTSFRHHTLRQKDAAYHAERCIEQLIKR
jgi:hypothetical protein